MSANDLFYSYSKLSKWSDCSEKFRLHYVDQDEVERPITDTVPTMTGNVIHPVLEAWYTTHKRQVPVMNLLDEHWEKTLADAKMGDELDRLKWIRRTYKHLIARGTAGYQGADPILTTTKGPNGQYNFPKDIGGLKKTTGWGVACASSGFDQERAIVDAYAQMYADDKFVLDTEDPTIVRPKRHPWTKVSLADVYLESYAVLDGYVDNLGDHFVHAMEFAISKKDDATRQIINPSIFPFRLSDDDPFTRYLNGFIDMVTTDRQGKLYIIDTKSSKTEPSRAAVAHWEQLNLYAWGHYMITKLLYGTGKWPDYIAINSVRHRSLVLAEFRPELIPGVLKRAEQKIRAIEARMFVQQNPSDFNQNCYKFFGDDKACMYLKHCHPSFAQMIGVT